MLRSKKLQNLLPFRLFRTKPVANVEKAEAEAGQTRRSADRRFVNVALGKPASQSSLSHWSVEGEAANAVSGTFPGSFAFHTDLEAAPWWQVDLLEDFPVEWLIIHNRQDTCQERAETLQVETSLDGKSWVLVHAGHLHFGGGSVGHPLELPLSGKVRVRYVRLSLPGTQYLHVGQVEVLCRRARIAFERFRTTHRLSNLMLKSETPGSSYNVRLIEGSDRTEIVGLKLNYSGRLGNVLQQYTHAILLAKKTGLQFVQLGHHELMQFDKPIAFEGVSLLPQNAPLPYNGAFIAGIFFNSNDFLPVLSPFLEFTPAEEAEHCAVARQVVRPHVLAGLTLKKPTGRDDELTIHLRAGDIFVGQNRPIIRWYRQPPLSYYQLVIQRCIEFGWTKRVCLVFEDRGNPCVDLLETWLSEHGIPFRIQSGTLADDLATLIDAPHLVFGYGTFGYAVCRLSHRIKTVHFFDPQLGGRYEFIPGIERVYRVVDAAGEYIRAGEWGKVDGEWCNTPEQRDIMCTYPIDKLRIEETSQPR